MKRSVVKWLRVDLDLTEHFAYIAQDKIEPAERLLVVAEESFDRLARFPMTGLTWKSPRRHLKGIRYYPMPAPYRNYVVFYHVTADFVEILAVLHATRDLEQALREIVE